MFYSSLEERHVHKEPSFLHQLDTWLSTYREVIIQSDRNTERDFATPPRPITNTCTTRTT